MLIALVGPTGVLGRALAPQLLSIGHRVRALARSVDKARALLPPPVEVAAFDLLAPDAAVRLPELLAGCDAVAHIATAIPRDGTALGAWDANTRLRTDGVRVLIAGALAARVPLYVQQSITMAYPDCGDEWISESAPLAGAGVGTPVVQMEAQVRAIAPGAMRWCILRCGNFVGPDTAQDDVISRLRAGSLSVPGSGMNWVSLVHVNDAAAAFVAALQRAPATGVFNICADPLRYGDYLDRLAEATDAPHPRRDPSRPTPPAWRCSSRAARETLVWAPQRGLYPG
ncbi:MAG: NAD(P)-dependent oxidoreductase [Chloroflexi bacterium]|nr:NAD(P)-dependent oxidoreductase [Chloroflexota bacterium]